MGRKKGYQREDLVRAAVGLFHAHGYAGTSTEQLVCALGVNRNSLYSEFGSKQALFDAALAEYEATVFTAVFGALEARDAGLDTIDALLSGFARSAGGAASGRGCLLCNTAVELAGEDPSGRAFVPRYFARMKRAFVNALDNSRRAGVLSPGLATRDVAEHLTATTLGLFVLVRARAPVASVKAAVRAARQGLGLLRKAAPRARGRKAAPSAPVSRSC